MNDVVERVARAMQNVVIRDDEGAFPRLFDMLGFSGENKSVTVVRALARAAIRELIDPGQTWDGLPRQIMMWLDIERPPTPRALFTHLERVGESIPHWLRDEPEMQALDHVPSKGTRCVIIYKAMLSAALADATLDDAARNALSPTTTEDQHGIR